MKLGVLSLQNLVMQEITGRMWTVPKVHERFRRRACSPVVEANVPVYLRRAISRLNTLPKPMAERLFEAGMSVAIMIKGWLQTVVMIRQRDIMSQEMLDAIKEATKGSMLISVIVADLIPEIDRLGFRFVFDTRGGVNAAATTSLLLQNPLLPDWKKYLLAKQFYAYDPKVASSYESYVMFLEDRNKGPVTMFLSLDSRPPLGDMGYKKSKSDETYKIQLPESINQINEFFCFPEDFDTALKQGNMAGIVFFWQKLYDAGKHQEELWRCCTFHKGNIRIIKRSLSVVNFLLRNIKDEDMDDFLRAFYLLQMDYEPEFLEWASQFMDLNQWPNPQHFTELLLRLEQLGLSDIQLGYFLVEVSTAVLRKDQAKIHFYPHLEACWKRRTEAFKQGFFQSEWWDGFFCHMSSYGYSNIRYTTKLVQMYHLKKLTNDPEFLAKTLEVLLETGEPLVYIDDYLKSLSNSSDKIRRLKKQALTTDYGFKLVKHLISYKDPVIDVIYKWAFENEKGIERYKMKLRLWETLQWIWPTKPNLL